MDHGNGHLVDDFFAGAADVQDGLAEDRNSVRQRPCFPPGITFGQGNSLVESQQHGVRIFPWLWRVVVLDEDCHVVHCAGRLGRNQLQGITDSFLKIFG
ncbi:hypothetical protein D3C73_1368690 [compost metagenome]